MYAAGDAEQARHFFVAAASLNTWDAELALRTAAASYGALSLPVVLCFDQWYCVFASDAIILPMVLCLYRVVH